MDPAVRRRRLIVLFASFAALLTVLVLIYLYVPATSFSPATLGYSVTGEVSGNGILDDSVPCEPQGNDLWLCEVLSVSRSTLVNYRVEMEGSRCWHGWHPAPGSDANGDPLPNSVSGCLKIEDQLRLWDRLSL